MKKNSVILARRVVLGVSGGLLAINTLFVASVSNMNFGVIMPAIIGLPLLALSIFYTSITAFFDSCVLGKLLKWGMFVVYAAFGVLFTFTTILILVFASTSPPKDADVLIILGAGLRGDRISLILRNRLDTGAEYLVENPNTVCIVSGGQGSGETVTEAFAMREYLINLGIDGSRIIEENRSSSTYENFLFSKEILDEQLGENVVAVFVTTDFHVFRAGKTAEAVGLNAHGMGSPDVWYISFNNYLRECAALTRGWLG